MIYLSSFLLSDRTVTNPNIYPYNVFARKTDRLLVFAPITVLYGNNASGKSTLLNIMANKIELAGKEYATPNKYGKVLYFSTFIEECRYDLGENEQGIPFGRLPVNSRYIKSEDILYEIKKIQQATVLGDDYIYEHRRHGMSKDKADWYRATAEAQFQMECMRFGQEKYSNGETTLRMLYDCLEPGALYLLDEPEVSLSPANQVILAQEINQMARLLDCQFIIATHSPFMLGILNARIYNLDSDDLDVVKWTELENVRYFYQFFKERENEF